MVGMLTVNSFCSFMRSCEYLSGDTLSASMGGVKEAIMDHASVMMFGLPSLSMLVTSIVRRGCSIL